MLALGAALLPGGGVLFAQDLHPVQPYISRAEQLAPLLPGRKQSFYKQPWRGYLETVPATQFLGGIGINYNLPGNADNDAVMKVLSDSGFKAIRLEIGWNSVSWDETQLSGRPRFLSILKACRKYGVRPLLLLNAHHGAPGPSKSYSRIVKAGGRKGSRTLILDSVADLVPGYSGLSYQFRSPMAGSLFTRIDSVTRTVTLSKPLPGDIAPGTRVNIHTLKYLPLYPVGMPPFEQTATGWIRYAALVCDLVRQAGIQNFDVEVWNELSFGSSFVSINNYYDPPLVEQKPDFLHPGGPAWELARRTVDLVRRNYPGARVIWGWSNTTFYHTPIAQLPPGIGGQSYHPYGTGKQTTPGDFPEKDRYSWFIEGYVPQGLTRCMPEGWAHLGIKTELLPRLLNPQARNADRPPGTKVFVHYMTEHGFSPREAGITTARDALLYKAKSLVRALLFWLNKGITQMDIYCAYEKDDLGMGMLPARPGSGDYAAFSPEQLSSPALRALKRVVGRLAGARKLDRVRPLGAEVVSLGKQPAVFAGDATHPALPYRDMFTFLPFAVSAHKFVCGVYVMSYDTTNPPPAMEFRLKIKNVKGRGATVSFYDPVIDKQLPIKDVKADVNSVSLRVEATDYPRLLILQEQEKGIQREREAIGPTGTCQSPAVRAYSGGRRGRAANAGGH